MTSNRNDIDINDPNFWQKWAKKADLDVEALGSKVCKAHLGLSKSNILNILCLVTLS